jgi:hypothetical protein
VLAPIYARLAEAVAFARTVGRMERDFNAQAYWFSSYEKLTRDRGGLVGALTSRSEAQVLRLSCLYALLDKSATVTSKHMDAAFSLWELCDDSTSSLFGDGIDDPIADKILAAVRRKQDDGLTQGQIVDLLHRSVPSYRIRTATDRLLRDRLIACEWRRTEGRSALVWYPADPEWTKHGRSRG